MHPGVIDGFSSRRKVVAVNDQRLGAAVRLLRIRRRWRQSDLAAAAGVSQTAVSRLERGHLAGMKLETIRSIASAIELRIDLAGRWRGGDLDRLLSGGSLGAPRVRRPTTDAPPRLAPRARGVVLDLWRARHDRPPRVAPAQPLAARHRAEDRDRRSQRACGDP